MRFIQRTPSRAVCILGRRLPERALQSDRHMYDFESCAAARRLIRRRAAAYLASHDSVTSVQVVAAARYGGFTVEQYDRADLV